MPMYTNDWQSTFCEFINFIVFNMSNHRADHTHNIIQEINHDIRQ